MQNNLPQQIKKIQRIYESISNADYNSESYKQKRFELIAHSEGFRAKIYRDIFDYKTIGYGFNLDQKDTKKIFDKVFKSEKYFNEILSGNSEINEVEAKKLMDYILDQNQEYIQKDYDVLWYAIPSDIKVSIESSYYNCPKIVNKGTNFHLNIVKYIATNNIFYLIKSYYELNFKSNPTNSFGIKNRRINDTPTWILNLLNNSSS